MKWSELKNMRLRLPHTFRVIGYRNPYRDWFVIVSFFSSLLLLLLIACSIFYYEIDRGRIFRNSSDTATELPIILNRETIKEVSDYYSGQDSRLNSLKIGTSTVVDPAQ